ncbi:SET domain-containing protein-lysine N-methyltransferase [Lentzea sp. NPDC051838]|uniref:SET domain-containing protein-lysine N-methyltransferase n=1 Tax=Lentzea sp. NPDC051838 TaxID=3154849 RepID=UPI00342B26E6
MQVGRETHVDVPREYDFEAILDRFYWRFMNHSCDPTVFVRQHAVMALKPVDIGQDITFNYNTTEFDMAEPFACRCGSGRCTGRVQGFRHLPGEERRRLKPWLAAHLATAAR